MSSVLRRATRAALATRVLTGRAFIAVAFTASIAFAFTACASAPVTTLGRDASGKIAFTSTTFPTTRLLTLDKEGTSTVVWGTLRLPSDTTRPAPGVIILHGAGGEGLNLSEWARDLNRAGFATFVIDSFSPRGIAETRTGTARINAGSRVVDAYRALELMATHPRVDPARIALMGFSAGGGVVLLARQTRFEELWMTGDRRFAAYLAFYPGGCNLKLVDERASPRPLRLFHGTADDQTIIEPCREYVARMRAAGQDVAMFEYPGAHHGFDVRGPMRSEPRVLSARNCVYVEYAPGMVEVTYRDRGTPARPPEACVSRGITSAYDPAGHDTALRDVKTFLKSAFGMAP